MATLLIPSSSCCSSPKLLLLRLFDLALITMEIEGDAAVGLVQQLLARPLPPSMEVMSPFSDFPNPGIVVVVYTSVVMVFLF
jgi:hypothetical protein